MADGRTYHALEFEPGRSDPDKKWALSVKQPLAGLVAMGTTPLITKSLPPPAELVGKRIALHAGAGHVPYKEFSEDAAEWAHKKWGASLSELRQMLPHGGVIATVKLEAAYKIGRAMHRKIYAAPPNRYGSSYKGPWHPYDGAYFFEQGTGFAGRWAWALTEPKLCPDFVPLRGHGGIFDLVGAMDLEAQRVADEAAHGHKQGAGAAAPGQGAGNSGEQSKNEDAA